MLPPGLGLAHLGAFDTVSGHHLGEARAWGQEAHVDGAAEVDQLQTDRGTGEHLLSRARSGRQTRDALKYQEISND